MNIVVCTLFMLTVVAAILTNRDLFSPAKFFLFSFLAFYVGILFDQQPLELWLLVLIVLTVGALSVMIEMSTPKATSTRIATLVIVRPSRQSGRSEGRIFLWIWVLSLPAIMAQIYMVGLFGGVEGYIYSVGMRNIEWRGLGWAKTLISTMSTLQLMYFAIGLIRPRSHRWWGVYCVHFLTLVAISLLSGSRSSILNIIALQTFAFHYLKRPIKLRSALSIAVGLIVAALVLGVVRDDLKVADGEIITGLDTADSAFKTSTFSYGIEALGYIVSANSLRLAYGSTFLSLLTNAVPRNWWPEKPESGGIFFTKQYTGDAWEGASNLTPSFLGEWIINFGWIAGVLLFLIAYPTMMYFVIKQYQRIRNKVIIKLSPLIVIEFLVYLYIMWAIIAVMIGEFTNVFLNLVLVQLIPLLVIRKLLPKERS